MAPDCRSRRMVKKDADKVKCRGNVVSSMASSSQKAPQDPPPSPTARKTVRGGVIAGVVVVAGALALLSISPATSTPTRLATGCSTQETTDAPDAELPPCKRGPFIFCGSNGGTCQPVGPEVPGCNTSDGTGPLLSELPRNRYPLGTVVDYVGQRDEQGNCKLDAVCKCQIGILIAQPIPSDDGGGGGVDSGASDAGPDADADVPAEAGTTPTPVDGGTGPVWSCYP